MTMTKRQEHWLALGSTVFFLVLLPLGLLGIFAWIIRQDIRLQTVFRQSDCVIVSKDVEERESLDTETGRPSKSYVPVIRYRFEVNGEPVESDRYDIWGGGTISRAAAQSIVNRFKVGESYPCWFDPDEPSYAVLTRDISVKYYWALIPVACLLGGFAAVVMVVREMRKGQQD